MADNVIVKVGEKEWLRGEDGFDPVVTVEDIEHGHRVTITDREHPVEGQSFDVLDGASAYEQAADGGYSGTEAEFNEELANFKEYAQQANYARSDAITAANTAGSYSSQARQAVNQAQSAMNAAQRAATQADNSAASASASESNAANSATNAAASETAAAASESAAAASATAAGNAQTAAETAQGLAEDAQEAAEQAKSDAETAAQSVSQSAAQIGQNASDISDLKSAVENLEVIPYSVKMAMDTLFSKAAYADDDAASSYAIFHAWASANPVEIRVFRGKGVSGATIVDNAKRALSEPVAFTNDAPITIEWPSLSAFRVGFKNTTTDVNTIDRSPVGFAPIEYLNEPKPSSLVVDGWLVRTGEEFICGDTTDGQPIPAITFLQSSGYVRLLFADISDITSPLPSDSIDSVFYINGIPYHLVETPVSEFE